ncbi:hypothetical protein, partial [Micromonospora sp. 4G55]|uniref:hypothetical protein n=2 Tax=Micromonospora sp. 4G55 TaxID=2806102 RepID=UPI001EE483AD
GRVPVPSSAICRQAVMNLHVVMVRISWPGQSGTVVPVGAFLTRQAADAYLASRHPVEGAEFYVETVPLSF